MSRIGSLIQSPSIVGALALVAASVSSVHAPGQSISQVAGGPKTSIHTPTGTVVHDGAPVFVREAMQAAGTRGDEGATAGAAPTGRCCLINGTCQITTNATCTSLNGVYMGDGTNCSEFNCGELGRCCINDNFNVTCQFVNIATCFNVFQGAYWQPGVTCEQSPCEPFGACCRVDSQGGTFCYVTAEFICQFYNGVWTQNTPCDSVSCDAVGACCTPTGCLSVTERQCAGVGVWQGVGSDCTSCPNLNVGACCLDRSTCLIVTRDDCDNLSGTYYGDGSICVSDKDSTCANPPAIGACCIGKDCHMTTQEICDFYAGTFFGVGEECFDVDCGNQPGACCLNNGLNCEVLLEGDCLAQNGTWAGPGTECSSGQGGTCPLYVGKCCLQNTNGTSYCLTLNIDQCFSTPGAVWWATPGVCEDPGAPHCPVFGACCLSSGLCQVIDQNICENIFGGVYKGDGTTCADGDANGQAEVCERPGDTNGDGHVNVADLLGVISHWGPCPAPCPWDVAPSPMGNGACNVADLLMVISNWG